MTNNYLHDFNDPPPICVVGVKPTVGDIIRLIDLDPSAGWAFACVVDVEHIGYLENPPHPILDDYTYVIDVIIDEESFHPWNNEPDEESITL